MDQLVESQSATFRKVMIFGGYCFGGVTLFGYLAYQSFKNLAERITVDRPKGQRLKLSKMSSFGGWTKSIAVLGVYFVGFGMLAWDMNIKDRIFRQAIQKDSEYTQQIKVDPFFQKFYIINTMQYFGISEALIKKTENELKQKVKVTDTPQKDAPIVLLDRAIITLNNMVNKPPKND